MNRWLRNLAFLSAIAPIAACAPMPPVEPGGAQLLELVPPEPVLLPGEEAVSHFSVRAIDPEGGAVWIGYSVQDPRGVWHDVAARPVSLPGADAAAAATMSWSVPDTATRGFYRVVVAVWTAPPDAPGARRLASVDRRDVFRVAGTRDRDDRLDTVRWERGEHGLGRGGVSRGNVRASGDGVELVLPPGSYGGAELRTVERVGHGRYTVHLRAPDAPGSFTAFFLYEDVPEGNDEIDIEIFNDGSRTALLNAWLDGELVHQAEVVLPFDPAADLHDYTIDHRPGELTFFADGTELARFTDRLPAAPMKLMLNAWWPEWLSGPAPTVERAAVVDRVWW